MATNGYIHYSNVAILPDKNETANTTFSEVLGNKTDDAANTANTSSIVALLRYVIANLSSDTDVAALIGALNTAAHTGAADDITTAMGYLKQLITDLQVTKGDLDDGGRLDLLIDAIKVATDEIGVLVNTGGIVTLSAILGDFANTTLISKFDVSTADVVSNDTVAQVIGNKTDTTATNGVSGTKSLMAYTKQLVAEGIVRDAKILAGIPQMITVNTPDASTTNWTQAAHRLFTVTGVAMVRVFGVISETLVSAGTLAVGVAGATAGCIATVADATTLAAGDILANSGTATLIPLGQTNEYAIVSGTDIDLTVGTADITDGAITFYCQWLPVSVGATVTAAIWD